MGAKERAKDLLLPERDPIRDSATNNTTKSIIHRFHSYPSPALAHEVKMSAVSKSFAILFMVLDLVPALYENT